MFPSNSTATASSPRDRLNAHERDSYMNIDDIIMSSAKLPCQFKLRVPDLGYLEPGSSKNDIDIGDKVDLPLWLAQQLYSSAMPYVSMDYTKPYKANNRAILDADATVVDLNQSTPFFYKFGVGILHFSHPDAVELSRILLNTFSTRLAALMDLSRHNMVGRSAARKKNNLNLTEQRLFKLGQKSLLSYSMWSGGQSRRLETSKLVTRYKKRKMLD